MEIFTFDLMLAIYLVRKGSGFVKFRHNVYVASNMMAGYIHKALVLRFTLHLHQLYTSK
jgi:hypothetical protein